MKSQASLQAFVEAASAPSWRWRGRLLEANAQTVEANGPPCSVGECCEIVSGDGARHDAEVIGFRGRKVIAMPLAETRGLRFGDAIFASGVGASVEVGDAMCGRVLDAMGRPIDEGGAMVGLQRRRLDGEVTAALQRTPIREVLATGMRAIDGLLTVGRGQRIGIFGGSGVGKSTLIGMMTRNTNADVTVVGLVGERGREVGEFLEDALGEEGRKRAVVMLATSDESPLKRLRCAMAATAAAEFYASQGKHVLLVLDSLTRFAMAAREIGLAAGEPPASKGYTPSVFTRLAKLVERAGSFAQGSITAFYTVLMEGDDQQDPVVDAVRSLLDGHIVLSRAKAAEGWYPPIDVLDSLSRLMPAVASAEQCKGALTVRQWLAECSRSEDLVRMGAYVAGHDAGLDRALAAMPAVRSYLQQGATEQLTLANTLEQLRALVG